MPYEKTMEACCLASESWPESLPEMMKTANEVATAILSMAENINATLFGENGRNEEKDIPPVCFRDALLKHRHALEQTARTLSQVCTQLGI